MDVLEPIKSLLKRFRKSPEGDFVKRRRYQVSVTSLSSRRQVFALRGKAGHLWLLGVGILLLAAAVWTLLLVYTPLRVVLPSRMSGDLREQYVNLAQRADSAVNVTRVHSQYAENILSILQDSVGKATTMVDEVTTLPLDSLIEASDAERTFVQRYEAAERYNVSVLSPIAAEGMEFYPPVTGLVSEDRISESGIPYVSISPGADSPVSAIYRGTVINAYYTTGRGTTIVVQHPNGFISQYSGLTHAFVTRGDKVNAGSRLGVASADTSPLTFELWHNGSPLSPSQYVEFQ